jgi:hypothetical protein
VQKYSFFRTIGDLAATTGGFLLLKNFDPVSPAVMKTYMSVNNIAAIKAWLQARPDQTATGLQIFTNDVRVVEPGSVDTTFWSNVDTNLQRFSAAAVDAAADAMAFIFVPTMCATAKVNAAKAYYAAPAGTNCIGYVPRRDVRGHKYLRRTPPWVPASGLPPPVGPATVALLSSADTAFQTPGAGGA